MHRKTMDHGLNAID